MRSLKLVSKAVIISFAMLVILGLTTVQGITYSPETIIQEFTTSPEPGSDHTRGEVIHALDKYWLFYDWNDYSTGSDIFVKYSSDLQQWSTPYAITQAPFNQKSVKAIYHDNLFYVIYDEGAHLYAYTSSDGLTYTPLAGFDLDIQTAYSNWDIIYARGWFYLAFRGFPSDDIYVARSQSLLTLDPTTATRVSDNPGPDFAPDLCWAKGRLWLAWDFTGSDGLSDIWITSSTDGIHWDAPVMIFDGSTYEYWGPFSLIRARGKFVLITRADTGPSAPIRRPWRIWVSTSRNGYSWTPLELVTTPIEDETYYEKGPTVFPIQTDGIDYKYAAIFKRAYFTPGFDDFIKGEIVQVFFNP